MPNTPREKILCFLATQLSRPADEALPRDILSNLAWLALQWPNEGARGRMLSHIRSRVPTGLPQAETMDIPPHPQLAAWLSLSSLLSTDPTQ